MSIKLKLIAAIAASLAAVAVATAFLVSAAGERNVRIAAEQAVAAAGQALASMERADIEKLDATLEALVTNPALVEAFAARDRARLLALAAPTFENLKRHHDVTHWYFHDAEPARTNFLRVHKPGAFGDVVGRATFTKAIETKASGAGKELGQTAFALRVVRPLQRDGRLLGYVELGEEIDHFLARMKAQTGDDYGLLVEKAFLDESAWAGTREGKRNNWNDRRRTVVVDTTTGDDRIIELEGDLGAIPDTGALLGDVRRDGRVLARGILPLRDASGRRVGGLFVQHDISALHDSMTAARDGILWMLLGGTALLAVLLLVLVERLVFARLSRMVATMEDLSARLAGGDYDVSVPRTAADDEIGRFERFFCGFLQVVAGLLEERTAKGRKSG